MFRMRMQIPRANERLALTTRDNSMEETSTRCLAIITLWGWFSHCGDCQTSRGYFYEWIPFENTHHCINSTEVITSIYFSRYVAFHRSRYVKMFAAFFYSKKWPIFFHIFSCSFQWHHTRWRTWHAIHVRFSYVHIKYFPRMEHLLSPKTTFFRNILFSDFLKLFHRARKNCLKLPRQQAIAGIQISDSKSNDKICEGFNNLHATTLARPPELRTNSTNNFLIHTFCSFFKLGQSPSKSILLVNLRINNFWS